MATLVEKITAPEVAPQVLEATMKLVEEEVASKRGLSGAAVKAGYAVVKAVKPGFIKGAIEHLLPDFARALEPMYEQSGAPTAGDGSGEAFTKHLVAHQAEAAEALLSVTDRKAQNAKNKTVKKTYEKMRGGAKVHVEAAIPNLAKTLGRFA